MEAVCPNDKIKSLRQAVPESDVDPPLGLLKRCHRVAEHVLNVCPTRLIDDLGQLKVHGMAPTTETKFFGQLDDGGLEPEPAEPVAEYRAGDARAGDEHATTAHRSASVSTTEPAATGSASDHNARVAVRLEPTGTMRG